MSRRPFFNYFDREDEHRRRHQLPADALIALEDLYTPEERRAAAAEIVAEVSSTEQPDARQLLFGFELVHQEGSPQKGECIGRAPRKVGSHDL